MTTTIIILAIAFAGILALFIKIRIDINRANKSVAEFKALTESMLINGIQILVRQVYPNASCLKYGSHYFIQNNLLDTDFNIITNGSNTELEAWQTILNKLKKEGKL